MYTITSTQTQKDYQIINDSRTKKHNFSKLPLEAGNLEVCESFSNLALPATAQLTFTCSKSTIEHQKKVWNMFKVNNQSTRMASATSLWYYCWQLWTYCTPFSSVCIVDFEQLNVSWENYDIDIVLVYS